jgi:hypothetical protein
MIIINIINFVNIIKYSSLTFHKKNIFNILQHFILLYYLKNINMCVFLNKQGKITNFIDVEFFKTKNIQT